MHLFTRSCWYFYSLNQYIFKSTFVFSFGNTINNSVFYHYIHYLFGCCNQKKCCYDIFIFGIHLEFHNFNLSKIYDRTTSSSEQQVRFSMGVYREEKIKLFENNTGCPADISLKMVILTSPHGAACLCVEYLLPLLTIYQKI